MTITRNRFLGAALAVVTTMASGCVTDAADLPTQEFDVAPSFGKFDTNDCILGVKAFFADKSIPTADDYVRFWKTERNAFGNKNNKITYSWELEGTNWDILKFYKPNSKTAQEWKAMNLNQRVQWFRSAEGGDNSWYGFERMADAPDWFRESLAAEGAGKVWETTSNSYAKTLDDLFTRADFVHKLDQRGGFHWHVSFKHNKAYADEITDFLALGNEYTTLRMFSHHPANIHHKYLGPYSKSNLNSIREGMRSGSPRSDKFSTFSVRTGIYGDPERIGYEIRAINTDVNVARRIVANAVQFLEDPKNALIKLGVQGGKGYKVGRVSKVDRIGQKSFERLPAELQEFLTKAANAADNNPGLGVPLRHRWAAPMVRWEERIFLQKPEVLRIIESGRTEYLRRITALMEQYQGGRQVGAEAQQAIEMIVYQWAKATRLFRYY